MASKTACLIADLILRYWTEDSWTIKKSIKPSGEQCVAEVDFESHVVRLYPHARQDGPVGRTMLHEGLHIVFEAYNDMHSKIMPLERLIWRGLDKARRDAFTALAEEE